MAQGRHDQRPRKGAVASVERGKRRMAQALVHAGAAAKGCGQEVEGGGAGRQSGGVVGG